MPGKEITKEMEILYLRDPNFCPFCEGKKITRAELVFRQGRYLQKVWCSECNEEWTDNFTRASITRVTE
jgi:hypothetical protein